MSQNKNDDEFNVKDFIAGKIAPHPFSDGSSPSEKYLEIDVEDNNYVISSSESALVVNSIIPDPGYPRFVINKDIPDSLLSSEKNKLEQECWDTLYEKIKDHLVIGRSFIITSWEERRKGIYKDRSTYVLFTAVICLTPIASPPTLNDPSPLAHARKD